MVWTERVWGIKVYKSISKIASRISNGVWRGDKYHTNYFIVKEYSNWYEVLHKDIGVIAKFESLVNAKKYIRDHSTGKRENCFGRWSDYMYGRA